MPCHLNGDVHEWFNEIVTVPNQIPPKLLPGEQARDIQWEAKTLWTFTATCCCGFIKDTQYRQERRSLVSAKAEHQCNTTYL